jgi:hypothetical protein
MGIGRALARGAALAVDAAAIGNRDGVLGRGRVALAHQVPAEGAAPSPSLGRDGSGTLSLEASGWYP